MLTICISNFIGEGLFCRVMCCQESGHLRVQARLQHMRAVLLDMMFPCTR